jgi:NtrC-family two-component system sensor histidine kinase KinB
MKSFSIRNKVRTGTVFLFILLLLTAGMGIFYVVKLKQLSREILKNNYESLDYCYSMQKNLVSMTENFQKAKEEFHKSLQLQEGNITEQGEIEMTQNLRRKYESLINAERLDSVQIIDMSHDISSIVRVNMEAIRIKSEITDQKAKEAVNVLSVIATLVFIVGLVFTVNFPSVITMPIGKLKEAVNELSRKNYKHRIHINTGDEFTDLADTFNILAEKLDMYEHSNLNQIMFQKSRAEAVINSLKDASIGIDKSGNILFANEQSLRLLNLKASEIVGKQSDEVAKFNDLFRFICEDSHTSPFRIVTDGKENFFVTDKYSILKDDEELGFVLALKNITSFQEKDTAKTNFLATISHELKTPLGSADIGLKLLNNPKTGNLNDMQKEIVNDLQKENARLLKLVSELLDMSQAETGNINLTLTNFDADEVVTDVISSLKPQAVDKEITLTENIPSDLKKIRADKEKAEWVLVNLVSNAIRYSPRGSEVVLVAVNSDGPTVMMSVIDNGPGIPPQYRDKIFKRFFKVPGRESEHNGTGLGLSISKEFMDAMGGKVEYFPAIPRGSEFRITFRAT